MCIVRYSARVFLQVVKKQRAGFHAAPARMTRYFLAFVPKQQLAFSPLQLRARPTSTFSQQSSEVRKGLTHPAVVALIGAGAAGLCSWWFWKKDQAVIGPNAVSASNALGKATFNNLVDRIASSIVDGRVVAEPLHIDRPEEQDVKEFISSNQIQTLIICGERGVGKSWLVESALKDEPGVVVIETALQKSLADAFLGKIDGFSGTKLPNDRETFGTLAAVFEAAAQKINSKVGASGDTHKMPTLVFEIESRTITAFVQDAATFSKRFSADKKLFHSILVLSDANAAFKLPEDAGRMQILYLGDLSETEADKFLDKSGLKDSMTPELRKKLYKDVGTRMLTLYNFVMKHQRVKDPALKEMPAYVDDFIKKARFKADSELDNLLTYSGAEEKEKRNGDKFQILTHMLLTDQYKEGVPKKITTAFMASPDIACETIKGPRHAISFHIPTATYRFNTPAHRWAAEQWAADEAEAKKAAEQRAAKEAEAKKPKWYFLWLY